MVRAALTPFAETQAMCSVWLTRYFNTYGDVHPAGDAVKLAVMQDIDIYRKYKFDQDQFTPPRPVVDISRFRKIWQTLYPTCSTRPWCGIPGKCDTCCEIDRGKRDCEDAPKQEFYKQAHHLHRGGLFMLERNA